MIGFFLLRVLFIPLLVIGIVWWALSGGRRQFRGNEFVYHTRRHHKRRYEWDQPTQAQPKSKQSRKPAENVSEKDDDNWSDF
ncbi:hypothetical protein FC34_GL000058 [Lacticaseibacillus brantae DSM 23927]|uniref:Uncharacterized protein n=2 Tax=Lacticaseibacillus brantae TaxID=943673 RepID=A0A0R2AZY8_9LACO|nr:hypothetical protein FC34_GL000058 [Lacticaseibacillus brantae DSM 23927]